MKRFALRAATVLALSLIGFIVMLALLQSKMIFYPTADLYRDPSAAGWEFEVVRVPVGEFETMGWYVHAVGEPKGVILFSHGNAGNIADRLESIGIVRALGYDVLAYDYGGYGESTGTPNEDRCYDDIRAMYRHLLDDRDVEPAQIVLHGRSLGAGPTCQLATEVDVAGVMIESTFRSISHMAREIYPWLPTGPLVRIHFDNEAKIPRINAPILVAHSPGDSLIPYDHGQRLFEIANEPKRFLEMSGDHNDGFWVTGERYAEALTAFLEMASANGPDADEGSV